MQQPVLNCTFKDKIMTFTIKITISRQFVIQITGFTYVQNIRHWAKYHDNNF